MYENIIAILFIIALCFLMILIFLLMIFMIQAILDDFLGLGVFDLIGEKIKKRFKL